MKWRVATVAIACLAMLGSTPLLAQEEEEDQIYLQEEPERDRSDWSLGLGFGLVERGDNVIAGQQIVNDDTVETYISLALRIPFGHRHAHRGNAGFRGYLEPEVARWDGDFESDTLVGLNIIGAMPFNAVEFFVGGGIGLHMTDIEIDGLPEGVSDTSDDAIGLNAQFGVDVSVSRAVSLFGVGRFDLVDDDRDELEGKASIGIRFRF